MFCQHYLTFIIYFLQPCLSYSPHGFFTPQLNKPLQHLQNCCQTVISPCVSTNASSARSFSICCNLGKSMNKHVSVSRVNILDGQLIYCNCCCSFSLLITEVNLHELPVQPPLSGFPNWTWPETLGTTIQQRLSLNQGKHWGLHPNC